MYCDFDRIPVLPELAERANAVAGEDAAAIARGGKLWDIYGSTLLDHNGTFGRLTGLQFDRWVKNEIREGRLRTIFEVMGDGQLPRHLNLPGLFTQLAESRDQHSIADDLSKGLHGVFGGILSRSVISSAKDYLASQGLAGFDLITCRPMGGVEAFWGVAKTNCLLISRLVRLLAVGGSLFYQLNLSAMFAEESERFERWLELIERQNVTGNCGIKLIYPRPSPAIRLERVRLDLPRLPAIPLRA